MSSKSLVQIPGAHLEVVDGHEGRAKVASELPRASQTHSEAWCQPWTDRDGYCINRVLPPAEAAVGGQMRLL